MPSGNCVTPLLVSIVFVILFTRETRRLIAVSLLILFGRRRFFVCFGRALKSLRAPVARDFLIDIFRPLHSWNSRTMSSKVLASSVELT